MPKHDAPNLSIASDRKPRERKSLEQRIAEQKEVIAAHEARAGASKDKLAVMIAEYKDKAEAMLRAVEQAGEG